MKIPFLLIIVFLLLFACGGDPKTTATPEDARSGASKGHEEEKSQVIKEPDGEVRTDGSILRAEIVKVLDAGPGVILSRVQTEPFFSKGKFMGFRIVAFFGAPPKILDLRPGDIVLSVNEKQVERPEDFFGVIEELKTASVLSFVVLRDGSNRKFSYPIVN